MRRLVNTKGFTLLEVMVALIVVAIGMLGIAAMMITSIRGNSSSSRLMVTTNLAQDKLEELRSTSYKSLYGNCGGAASWTGGDPAKCNEAPANMADSDPPMDNGTKGDELAGDGIWTYQYASPPAAAPLNNYNLIWTVQRNYPQYGLIRAYSVASWVDNGGQVHQVRLETILANF